MSKTPRVWWDLEGKCARHGNVTRACYYSKGCLIDDFIIIESDDKRYPIIKKWAYTETYGQILKDKVEPYIKDVNEGRLSFFEEAKKYKEEDGEYFGMKVCK